MIFLTCVYFLVPPDLEWSYTGSCFEGVRSTAYDNRRSFGCGFGAAAADGVAFGAAREDFRLDLEEASFCEEMAEGGGEVPVVLVAVSVERHRALVNSRECEMGVERSRPLVATAARKGNCRIIMC